MPRIRPYGPSMGAPGVTEQARARPVSIAPGLSDLSQGVGQLGAGVFDIAAQNEINQAAYDLSQMRLNKTRAMMEMSRNVISDDQFDTFMQKYDDESAALYAKLKTSRSKDFFIKGNLDIKTSLQDKFETSRVVHAEDAAITRFNDEHQANLLTVREDPSQLEKVISSIYGIKPDGTTDKDMVNRWMALPVDKRSALTRKMSQGLAEAAVEGQARQNPAAARAMLKDPQIKRYLGGDGYERAERSIMVAEQAIETERRRREAEQERRLNEARKKTQADFLEKMATGKGVTDQEILNSNLDPVGDGPGSMLGMIKLQRDFLTKYNDRDDPIIVEQIESLISSGQLKDSSYLYRYAAGKGLSNDSLKRLSDMADGRSTVMSPANREIRTAFLKRAEKALEWGDYPGFLAFVQQQEKERIRDNKDLKSLYTTGTSDYLGNYYKDFMSRGKSVETMQRSGLWMPPMSPPEGKPIEEILPAPKKKSSSQVPVAPTPVDESNPGVQWLKKKRATK